MFIARNCLKLDEVSVFFVKKGSFSSVPDRAIDLFSKKRVFWGETTFEKALFFKQNREIKSFLEFTLCDKKKTAFFENSGSKTTKIMLNTSMKSTRLFYGFETRTWF